MKNHNNSMTTASLIIGIAAFVGSLFAILFGGYYLGLSLYLSIIGMTVGLITVIKYGKLSGFILSIIAILICILYMFFLADVISDLWIKLGFQIIS